jgi:hypothetical protein
VWLFILGYSSINREICQGVQRTFQQIDYKQLYIFEVNLVELNSNIFVELPISFSHFTRFFIL